MGFTDWYKPVNLPTSVTSLYFIVIGEDDMDMKHKIKIK